MNVGWIWTANLRPFVQVLSRDVGYQFDASDWIAIEFGLGGTDSEAGPWFDYPIGGLTLSVALEPGACEMVTIRIDGDTSSTSTRIDWLADLMRCYDVACR